MRFIETKLKGAFIIEPEKLEDERGFFARSFCRNEFKEHGLNDNLAQCNISFNKSKGTMRGMHLQVPPKAEAKLVRCTMGAIYDVIVDLQKDSSTYKKHIGVTLTPENRKMLYVPEGFVHGFITLEDNTEVFYQMSEFYAPEFTIGYRWNDPAFNIDWPIEVKVVSDRDRDYPDFT
jgi:dTDP-4-dehydrorhamnose 3,5-epimerase